MVTNEYQPGDSVRVRVGRGTVVARLVTSKADRRGKVLVEIDSGSEDSVIAPVSREDLLMAS